MAGYNVSYYLSRIKQNCVTNYRLPLFNGSKETDLEEYNKYLLNLNIKTKNLKSNVGGIQILKYKKDSVFFDIGNPPKKNFSSTYQSGPLSFEYFNENEKIITNCGFGSEISKKAAESEKAITEIRKGAIKAVEEVANDTAQAILGKVMPSLSNEATIKKAVSNRMKD